MKGVGTGYSVKEAFKRLHPRVNQNPVKDIWLPNIPPKMVVYTWEATWDRVLTLAILQKSGSHLPNRWYLYGKEEEIVHHILLCVFFV